MNSPLKPDMRGVNVVSKHTPGPWSLPHFAEPDTNCNCGYVLTDHLMGAVATVHCSGEGEDWSKHGDNPKFQEAVANARLIAAAPDMLAALQSLTKDPPASLDEPDPDWEVITKMRAIARAAVAKALGADDEGAA